MRSLPALVCLSFFAAPYGLVHAQAVLSEEAIKAFYQEMETVQMQGPEEVVAFYDRHTPSDVKMSIIITKLVMGKVIEPEILDMDKKELLERIDLGHRKGPPDEVKLEIVSSEIAADGLTAKVKENLYGRFTLKTQDSQGMKEIPAEQSMLCNDSLILSSEGIIQIQASTCELKATMGSVAKQK